MNSMLLVLHMFGIIIADIFVHVTTFVLWRSRTFIRYWFFVQRGLCHIQITYTCVRAYSFRMLLSCVLSAKSTKYVKLNRVRKFLRLLYFVTTVESEPCSSYFLSGAPPSLCLSISLIWGIRFSLPWSPPPPSLCHSASAFLFLSPAQSLFFIKSTSGFHRQEKWDGHLVGGMSDGVSRQSSRIIGLQRRERRQSHPCLFTERTAAWQRQRSWERARWTGNTKQVRILKLHEQKTWQNCLLHKRSKEMGTGKERRKGTGCKNKKILVEVFCLAGKDIGCQSRKDCLLTWANGVKLKFAHCQGSNPQKPFVSKPMHQPLRHARNPTNESSVDRP